MAPTKTDLLAVMDSVWRELDAQLEQFGEKLEARMPGGGPTWTGRQLLGHILGLLQSTPYYLMQARHGGVVEVVIGDPYWRQIYATATIGSFRAMAFAAHIGMVMLVESTDDADLQKVARYPDGSEVTAVDIVHFNYHVHLRSHVEDLKKWGSP